MSNLKAIEKTERERKTKKKIKKSHIEKLSGQGGRRGEVDGIEREGGVGGEERRGRRASSRRKLSCANLGLFPH